MLSILLFLAMLVGIDAQNNCTIDMALSLIEERLSEREGTQKYEIDFIETKSNCLATSEIRGFYEHISMSVKYLRDDDNSTIHKARYTYVCHNDFWRFWYEDKSETSYFNGTRSDCWNCGNRTVNDHHCLR